MSLYTERCVFSYVIMIELMILVVDLMEQYGTYVRTDSQYVYILLSLQDNSHCMVQLGFNFFTVNASRHMNA